MRVQGENMICLRDPLGLAAQPIFLTGPQAFLVSLMDGTNSLRDIQASFFREAAEILPISALEDLVKQLDAHHYLDSPSFRVFYDSLVQEFRRAPTRPARHAGEAYEGREETLRLQIDGFFTGPGGPGPISAPEPNQPVRGLIAPHIDFCRGGPTYAHAYKVLAEHPGADRFIVFGTCHNPMRMRFALTEKDYETPLGAASADCEFIRRLALKLPTDRDYFQDEFAHRGEHSIEFQMVCLRYVLGSEFKVIPILVGSFQEILLAGRSAAEDPEVTDMVMALKEAMAELPGRYCVIAGADLAHIGRHFGDPMGPTESSLRDVAREDRKFLEYVEHGDAEGAFRFIAAERDRRRVCGYPPIYMALRCLENPRGQLLDYRQWSDLQSGAAVTFASIALF
jgi:AmmeMemoRadiSam system protein B